MSDADQDLDQEAAALRLLAFSRLANRMEHEFPDVAGTEEGRRLVGEYDAALAAKHPDMDPEKRLRAAFTKAREDLDQESDYPDVIRAMKQHRDRHYFQQPREKLKKADTIEELSDDEYQADQSRIIAQMAAGRMPRLQDPQQQKRAAEDAAVQKRRRAMGG